MRRGSLYSIEESWMVTFDLKQCAACKQDFRPYRPVRQKCCSRVCMRAYYKSQNEGAFKRRARDYYLAHPEKFRYDSLKRKHCIEPRLYWHMMIQQEGRCAICGTHEPSKTGRKRRMSVDHDHTTDKIRGLLCDTCNRGIGLLKDSPNVLRAATAYLERSI